MSIHWPIIKTCIRNPLSVGMIDDARSWKRAEVLVAAMNLAEEIRRGCASQTVGVMMPSSGAFAVAALAGWIAGKVVVPLNFLLKEDELGYVLKDCGTDTVVTVCPLLEFMGYSPKGVKVKLLDKMGSELKRIPEAAIPSLAADDDLGVLLYTSGTSGKPKGVMLTHGNVSSNIRQCISWVGFSKQEVLLGVLPQFHSFGMTVLTLLPLTHGCQVVYSAKFLPSKIVKLIREHKATAMIAIPSMYNALLHVKDGSPGDFVSMKYAVSGGEPLPDAVARGFFEKFGVRIAEGYGLTETSPVTNWCRPGDYKSHSVGMALPDVIERIVDPESGKVLGANEDGEVRIKGPNLMKGYFGLEEETARAFDELGFLRTGDIGRFDIDGHLYITGRLKDMIIVGGENVFPREIEEVLNHHPAVKESGVVGKRDEIRGEQPLAFVEFKEGQSATNVELFAWCRQRLAGYKVPSDIRIVGGLPRGPTGKVLRRELRAMA